MNTKLLTTTFNTETADMFIRNVNSEPYYLFVGKNIPYTPDDQTLEKISNAIVETTSNAYNNMQFGRRVKSTDVVACITRHDWQSGTVFSQYENTDEGILARDFHCVVNNGGNYHVYKCLFNNNGANSTVQPTGQDLQPFSSPVDGYIWKYMYTFSSTVEAKFATTNVIPVFANSVIQAAAIPGTIEVIQVLDAGKGYANHFESSFRAQDITVGGTNNKYALTEDASGLNQFYRNCIFKITTGPGVNQYRKIIDYTISGGQKVITLDGSFSIVPEATDSYQIYPAIKTTGDGLETVNCDAWAIIDQLSGNAVSMVEVLNPGENYRTGTSTVLSDNTVSITATANVAPIISPAQGHGYDPAIELGASQVCISIQFKGTEGARIPTDNDYRTLGLIRNPKFANVIATIDFGSQIGVFSLGETVHSFRQTRLSGQGEVTSGSPTIIGSNTDFIEALSIGTNVLVTDGINNLFAQVEAITNTASITLSSNSSWSNTGCSVGIVNYLANATLLTANTESLVLENVDPNFNDNYLHIIGELSGATVDLDSGANPRLSINGSDTDDFDIFVQLVKVTGTLSSGSFVLDEDVVQGTSLNPVASLFSHTSGSPDYLYLSNLSQQIDINNNITGKSSGAVFVPLNKYNGELALDSGEIMYIENIDPITRAFNKSETVKIILEF